MIILFLDDPMISNIVFYPRKHSIPSNLDENIEVLKFQINDEILIGGFFYKNDIKLPTILLFHGNGEIAMDYQYFISLFFECNVNLAVMDFRGYGFSTGNPVFSCLYDDALPVYTEFLKWIDEKGINDSIFVLGRSLGSHCAAEIGAQNPDKLHGIIFESAIGSTYTIMKQLFRISNSQLTSESVKDWSNDRRASKFKKPTLIIHGTSDWIVPNEHGKILYNSIPNDIEKELIMIEGAGHNTIFQFKDNYFTPLKKFIDKYK